MYRSSIFAITTTIIGAAELSATTTNESSSMDFVTFNMLFSPWVEPSTYIRRNKTTRKVTKVNADVMCLQEIWTDDLISYVEKKLRASDKWGSADIYYERTEEDLPWWQPELLTYDGHNGLMLVSKRPIKNK